MQETNVRIGTLDHFAVELKHQTQHAMRGRMLGPKIEGVILNLGHYLIP
jgi:hypothetical protein